MVGKKILNYEIKKLLGEGGMGNVYLAEHTQLGRKVAVKSLHPQLVKNEGLRARFKNEASTMAHLQHPKIVTLYDYVEEEDGLFLVMEFVEGLPLDEYIREKSGPIPSEIAIPMMMQILDAFSYAHSKGIVHRDIKPSNIIISDRDEIKILDFGIAKLLSEAGNKLTKTGTQMGTVFYMSPEQVQGKDIDTRSDIYSLGVTFYQMLTGISPYDGMTTEFEVYSKIVSEPLPNASSLYPGVPKFLDKVILKATAKNKADRFQSCEEFSGYLSKRETPITESKTVGQTNNPLQNQVLQERAIKKNTKLPLIVFIIIAVIAGLIIKGASSNSNSSDDDYIDADTAGFVDTLAVDSTATIDTQYPVEAPEITGKSYPVKDDPAYEAPVVEEGKQVEFKNNSSSTAWIAYAFYDRGWEIIGWVKIPSGNSRTINLPATFTTNTIYWYGYDELGREWAADFKFCVEDANFHYYADNSESCPTSKGFHKLDVSNNYTYKGFTD